ncbi:MAG: hypothetical protein IJV05_06180 [Muribaculaceae bacterium]|nr:hypothetical protein [Muribaculaceae bacterium]
MKEFKPINSQQELERLIERYFDGMTTVEEEDAMRLKLAHCPWSSQAIDDAKAVMGYFAVHSCQQGRHATRGMGQRSIGIAASVAIILAIGGFAIWHQQQASDICIAYVNGEVVRDNDKVMTLVNQDLNRMDNATNAMAEQLSSLGEALELDNE